MKVEDLGRFNRCYLVDGGSVSGDGLGGLGGEQVPVPLVKGGYHLLVD